jgi:hypothetical protein
VNEVKDCRFRMDKIRIRTPWDGPPRSTDTAYPDFQTGYARRFLTGAAFREPVRF